MLSLGTSGMLEIYHIILNSRPVWEGLITKISLIHYQKFICIDNICVGNKMNKIIILIPVYNDWQSVS